MPELNPQIYSPKDPRSKKKKKKKASPSPKIKMRKGELRGLFKRRTQRIDEAAGF
jgi:hypothetical protein